MSKPSRSAPRVLLLHHLREAMGLAVDAEDLRTRDAIGAAIEEAAKEQAHSKSDGAG